MVLRQNKNVDKYNEWQSHVNYNTSHVVYDDIFVLHVFTPMPNLHDVTIPRE